MRINLTCLILLMAFLQVTLAANAQKISLSKKNAPLTEIFKELRKQSGYGFMINKERIKISKPVTINVNGEELLDVLDKCFKGQPFTYRIEDKMIIVVDKRPEQTKIDLIQIEVKGRIVDERGEPLIGASVKIKGTERVTRTADNGAFTLSNVDEDEVLEISYLGYKMKEIKVSKDLGNISMEVLTDELEEVQVSTGYQTISKERITGSVTVVDNELLNRAVSPDILSRLNSVTNGLLIDSKLNNTLGISVRGRSTIFSSTKPLIVVDNFPFEGDINTINPNDIENVSVLKDAAAASIWGVKAGNGVIVITTKKGKLNQPISISFNSNVTIGEKPDLYYQPQLTSSEFIEVEKFLFANGKYKTPLRNNYALISPVIALLNQRTDANATAIDAQIESLKQNDIREQLGKYMYRNSVNQQYYLSLNGGGSANTYNLSAGYDVSNPNQMAVSNNRFTLKANNTFNFFKDKLQLSTDLNFNVTNTSNENANSYTRPLYPYEQIANENGNALAVLTGGSLRAAYTDTAGAGRLLDWKYRPLDELRNKANVNETELMDIRLNAGLKYRIFNPLSVSVNYQYYKSSGSGETVNDLNSFQTRNSINSVTQINRSTGAISYPFPIGSIFSRRNNIAKYSYGRAQLDYQNTFSNLHNLTVLAGYEIRSENTFTNAVNLAGYDPETAKSITQDNVTNFPYYYGSGSIRFNSNPASQAGTVNHFISYYSNLSYSYDRRYVIYGSFRKDESNLFGVKSNQKGVPLWSTGVAWNLQEEKFFKPALLEKLQLRVSYGYNGNVNQTLSAYTTASPSTANVYGSPTLSITNPPNPSLSWERVKNVNTGIDFSLKNAVLIGSIEFYTKQGVNLIGEAPIAQQTGQITFTGNVADTKTKGLDIQLTSRNVNRAFKWFTTAYLNIAKDKVTRYMANIGTNYTTMSTISVNPILGFPIRSIFGYKSTVLDSQGNPQGFLNGQISRDYISITNSMNLNELKFYGSAVPTVFGAFRNTFSYKEIELSINISYKLGYYFRNPVLQSSTLFNGEFRVAEYNQRWQKPGDELITTVPSLLYPASDARDVFYTYSESTISKGDHIRLNDISLTYSVPSNILTKLRLNTLSIYTYANNLGIIWKANKKGIDPDVSEYPNPKSFSIGLRTNF